MDAALTERHVQALWYDAARRPPRLVTRRGTVVTVISPGDWNGGPGPDFHRAVLELGPERRRVTGDVEVHLCPADWDLHGHGTDARYRNVIAHVTWGCGPAPASLPPGAVSIWLGRFFTGRTDFEPADIDLAAYPFGRLPLPERPCFLAFSRDPDRARAALAAAGVRRLHLKARRLEGRLCAAPGARRQIFYEEVMNALGYSRNTAPFRRLAERLPLAVLPADAGLARAALLAAGGFEEWDRTSLRPGNSPEHRLECAAALFTTTTVMALASADDFSRTACREMIGVLSDGHCMGRGRAAAIVANVVAPFAVAEGRLAALPAWLPPEDLSQPVRLAAFRLFDRDHNPPALYSTNGLLIQGLIQIYREQCETLYPDCARCALPDQGAWRPRPEG